MRVLIAPDSFKGSITALQAAEAMERGVRQIFSSAEISKVPIADGGEGTVAALVAAVGGEFVRQTVTGPLGEPVDACWGMLEGGKTAVVEMAAASGLTLLPKEKLDPKIATSFGTGELIRAVLDRGIRRIIIGIGGSATNDGGAGMVSALGARFLNAAGEVLPPGGLALAELSRLDVSGLDGRLKTTEIWIACDVDNPLCGPRGASVVYGPQKGATPEIVAELDKALEKYADIAAVVTGRNVAERPGAGAAGGLGAGFLFFTDAVLRPGIELILETAGFAAKAAKADLVLTGEGSTDFQTAFGKAPVGVAKAAKKFGVPVICISGNLGQDCEQVLEQGVDGLMSIAPGPVAVQDSIRNAAILLEKATVRVCRLLQIGSHLTRPLSNG